MCHRLRSIVFVIVVIVVVVVVVIFVVGVFVAAGGNGSRPIICITVCRPIL